MNLTAAHIRGPGTFSAQQNEGTGTFPATPESLQLCGFKNCILVTVVSGAKKKRACVNALELDPTRKKDGTELRCHIYGYTNTEDAAHCSSKQ